MCGFLSKTCAKLFCVNRRRCKHDGTKSHYQLVNSYPAWELSLSLSLSLSQCVQFSSNSRKILEFWLLDDFPRILVYPRGSSRKFDSGSNSADLWVSSRKFGSGVVPSIACVTFMVYTNSAIEIIHNTIENPHFCRALRAHINAGFLRFPYFVAFSGDLAKLLRSLRSQYIL